MPDRHVATGHDVGVTDSFPRQHARTQRLTLGEPRNITVSLDGSLVVFARSQGGSDSVNCLWTYETTTGAERLLVNPREVELHNESELPEAELRRRERAREAGGGIVSYTTDAAFAHAVFPLGGQLMMVSLESGAVRALPGAPGAFDPRISPAGDSVGYVAGNELRIIDVATAVDRLVAAEPDNDNVSWGSAEFVAAEEMNRYTGWWFDPTGAWVAAARVDTTPINIWYISNPADPSERPAEVAYPAAGTNNADVSLWVISLATGERVEISWGVEQFPYLVDVTWTGQLTLFVMSRDQRRAQVLAADTTTGSTTIIRELSDAAWIDTMAGCPAWAGDRLVTIEPSADTYRLCLDGEPVTPPGLNVQSVANITEAGAYITGTVDPLDQHVWHLDFATAQLTPLSRSEGLNSAVVGGATAVVRTSTLGEAPTVRIIDIGASGAVLATLESLAETPLVRPVVTMHTVGERQLRVAVLWPGGVAPVGKIPVLLDPYGGPHGPRVVNARNAYCTSQWFADQGFAVIVADGRGTPNRGPAWDRTVLGDLATPALDDQVDALNELAKLYPQLDMDRVAIRGWSFGGYLAALAVLRRPDVFHSAIAGAPGTEWRLYDTFYSERYLGDPNTNKEAYDRSSLLPLAADLTRPLLLVHGFADDNVVIAHTLQLSGLLLANGCPHEVLPLVGVTHMASQEEVAENLLLHQVDFLRRSLGLGSANVAASFT